jgi:hypothetical protein
MTAHPNNLNIPVFLAISFSLLLFKIKIKVHPPEYAAVLMNQDDSSLGGKKRKSSAVPVLFLQA